MDARSSADLSARIVPQACVSQGRTGPEVSENECSLCGNVLHRELLIERVPPSFEDPLSQQGRLVVQLVEDGLDRLALQGRQKRQDLSDWLRDVPQGSEGVLQDVYGFRGRLFPMSNFRVSLDCLPLARVSWLCWVLTFCSASRRFERDLADALGRAASMGTTPAGAGRATSSSRVGRAWI